eukprot:CAMPEP_0119108284 /NCGR_PEP_ID=MMETSP1180-20130426/13567_1 /TAXON_ID=3052 ORGANISM="Chlamydomonas cf sp, Strain CCMP681" /NCGR_SAMPLE_ID=MMETSP1180 /ASSEMBLY_ACC=CAM_ASM_000741 /LENGTH=79 /DNA_ID=CAMNT_0007093881 /DNA_START=834 /DNA_END=1073 /DNA_ORIENTATION=-
MAIKTVSGPLHHQQLGHRAAPPVRTAFTNAACLNGANQSPRVGHDGGRITKRILIRVPNDHHTRPTPHRAEEYVERVIR